MPCITAPSTKGQATYNERHIREGSLADDAIIFKVFLSILAARNLPERNSYHDVSEVIFKFVRNLFVRFEGGMPSGTWVNEQALSAVLCGLMSRHIASLPGFESFIWQHQPTTAGGVCDLALSQLIDDEWIPRVCIEVSINNNQKDGQLTAYINNLDAAWPSGSEVVMIGVVLFLSAASEGSGSFISIYGYYKRFEKESHAPNLCYVLLHTFDYNVRNIERLLHTIYEFVEQNKTLNPIRPTVFAERRLRVIRDGEYFYKEFDYRNRKTHINSQQRRSSFYNVRFIPHAEIVVAYSDITIIRYPYVKGSHTAKISTQWKDVLDHLYLVHKENVCHGDIRASNIIFADIITSSSSHSSVPSSSSSTHATNQEWQSEATHSLLIDFDYSGVSHEKTYPKDFNIEIDDGKRHSSVDGGQPLAKEHDIFSIHYLMSFYKPESDTDNDLWNTVLGKVADGDLEGAISLLANSKPFAIRSDAAFPSLFDNATGSPIRNPKRNLSELSIVQTGQNLSFALESKGDTQNVKRNRGN